MPEKLVNIDFKLLQIAFRKHVREKAIKAGGTIVYQQGQDLIEENPKTAEKRILRRSNHTNT